ncbi:PASTA domain-containing protein [Kribbella soli]|uniref:PASTA domain-containing protein n=1 Tax=Kribbella soli TaxID=1124743 RepID=A0A4V2LXV3_9ACTN|nr:PASTA domain-containing protein [Kribbella soli]TCC01926.1 PASTA domain-containing protein [Kribbella soli]
MSIHRAKYLIAAAAVAIATLLSAGTAAAGVAEDACTESAEWTASPSPVPKVLGLSLGAAADRLRAAGHNCKIVNHNLVQVDERAVVVVKQEVQYTPDPDGGYSVVALTRGVVMPDLVGKTWGAAEKIAARRTIAVRALPASGAADWTVEFQNPGAGAYMMFGDEASLKLSEPVPPDPVRVPVPDLIGSTEDEAAALVKDAGLNYKERILKDGKRPGRVVSQQPQPGELVERATTVRADVRRVPAPPPTTVVPTPPPTPPAVVRAVVPDLVGRLESTAKQAVGVARLKFRSRVVRPGNAPGIVLNQHPRAGTEVDVGTVVAVDVTRAPKPKLVPVPDLLNRSEDDARGAVEGAELIFDLIGGSDASGHEQQVISQQPRAGELVPTGTTVTVEFAASESNWPSWLVPLLLGTAVLAAGTVSRIRHRPGSDPKPVPHVQAAGRLTPGIPQIHESGPAHRIRVNARLDRGRQYLQEKTDEHH